MGRTFGSRLSVTLPRGISGSRALHDRHDYDDYDREGYGARQA
jgi:hypothetical protein